MDRNGIFKFCKELGCCDTCCLRYVGIKNQKHFEDSKNIVAKLQSPPSKTDTCITAICPADRTGDDSLKDQTNIAQDTDIVIENNVMTGTDDDVLNKSQNSADHNETLNSTDSKPIPNLIDVSINPETSLNGSPSDIESVSETVKENGCNEIGLPPVKRCKLNICSSCLGVLQEDLWLETFEMVKEALEKKRYDCSTFACALSSPMAIILREKSIVLRLRDKFPDYNESNVTALKESWKWSFATRMAGHIQKTLDSGAVSPLLITLNYDYPDDLQELEILKAVSPMLFQTRRKQKRRFATEFTRRCVEQALEKATLESLTAAGGGLPLAAASAKCVSVVCNHNPMYLGGRYVKLSRNLPQSPWVLDGKRMLPSSVQEIIFKPIAELYGFSSEEAEQRLKFVAAGREDVDVRCLGDGRPFAIEISDPRRQLTSEELVNACEEISKSEDVIVKRLVPINRDDLTQLKKGEETKSKTYEALCIKLTHSKYDEVSPESPITVTDEDIKRMNEFRNTDPEDPWTIKISQKTPIRVLHRRPLITRSKGIISVDACKVPEHRQLFVVVVRASAGTYVKEWVSGELGRTRPALAAAMRARAALLALDVLAVHLHWPPSATADQ